MADSYGDRDVNLSALQRVDQYIVEVLSSATQVALYKFSSEDNEWARTGVEGTLFVYRRSALPFYGFLIMNRLSKTNQVEPITKDLELKKEDPYLLYRNLKLNIFGIWFYEPNDCVKISDAVNRLLTHEKEKHRSQQRIRRASESDTGMNKRGDNADIFSMLSKAQEVYLKNTTSEPKPIVESPNAGAAAAASADIIRPRAVRVVGGGGGAPDVTRTTPSNLLTPEPNEEKKQLTIEDLFARASDVSIARAVAGGGVVLPPVTELSSKQNPILQRLMSNPENLVEHIEKRQRNETLPLSQLPEEKPKTFARISTSSSTETNVESSNSPKSHMDSFFTPAMFETPDPVTSLITPTKQPPSFPQSLHMSLMSPMMFSTPMSFTATPLDRRPFPLQLPDLQDGEIEPLTKAQLVQAFTHLLKTDPLFVNKLHEAYVNTLQRRSNNNKNGWERKSNGLF